jgi:hypothetical protein
MRLRLTAIVILRGKKFIQTLNKSFSNCDLMKMYSSARLDVHEEHKWFTSITVTATTKRLSARNGRLLVLLRGHP